MLSRNTKQQSAPHSTIEMDSTILILHYCVAPAYLLFLARTSTFVLVLVPKLNAIWFPMRTAGCELVTWGVYT